ncbi:MAG: capsular polysaccharide biosynthesis protein [Gammaproteobacteria bacterium]|nr:capsular polysaccharide biosynthesis protein [Gammaproteobacteria bacterium]
MTLATYSRGIRAIPILEEALGQTVVAVGRSAANDESVSGYVGWGRKNSGLKAEEAASRTNKSVVFLEDGFLGYWGHPGGNNIRLSLNIDHQGIYYDAREPSDLESMLADGRKLDAQQTQRALSLIESITTNRFSKYNHHSSSELPASITSQLAGKQELCLVVDQTAGDQSIDCGLAGVDSFGAMLQAAVDENPDALIIVKTHPDVLSGTKKSAIGKPENEPRIIWIADDVHPHALIEAVDKVYVVTSQMGFEALLFGKQVVCFGVPFYSGWGLTDDRGPVPARRNCKLSLAKLVYDSLIRYPVYVHPDTGKRAEVESIIDWLCFQKRQLTGKHEVILAVGFSLWKKAWLSAYTSDIANTLKFVSDKKLQASDKHAPLLVWGARKAEKLRAEYPDRLLFTMEDGFVRSAGLGTDLKRPSSLIIDRQGIYYDCRRPSDLEQQLNSCQLSDQQLAEARSVMDELIASGTTKYNVGSKLPSDLLAWISTCKSSGRQVILVPGQVEGDASLEFGSPRWRTNLQLLQEVRNDFPEACIIYKPHPDIVAKNRKNDSNFDEEMRYTDKIVIDSNISLLYSEVDRVCTLTSLSGFEALIRGVSVTVYGLPFYAGWGLTDDRLNIERRQARLTIEQLVYISLVRYPRYINWHTWQFCSLQTVMRQLRETPVSRTGSDVFSRTGQKLRYFVESWRRA